MHQTGKTTATKRVLTALAMAALWLAGVACGWAADAYHSPEFMACSQDGSWLAVTDVTAGSLILLDGAATAVKKTVALKGVPRGVAWHKGLVYVSEYDAGTVAEVDPAAGSVKRRFAVGPKPFGLAVDPAAGRLLVVEFGLAQLLAMDLESGKEVGRVPLVGLPRYVAVTPDGTRALIVNSNPGGDATKADQACVISVVDLKTLTRTSDLRLPPGAINPRGIAISPDGKWAYVVHGIGRFTLPTTQLDRGWIMTNGMTIFDLTKGEAYATLLLDTVSSGSADPWGLALVPDGKTAWITLAGCNELLRLNMDSLHTLLDGKGPKALVDRLPADSAWKKIAANPSNCVDLVNDLSALHASGAKTAIALPGKGPRGVVVLPSGNVAVAEYFSGTLAVGNAPGSNQPSRFVSVSLGPQPEADAVRRGEAAYHSADLCFQRWLSCASCHPDARADGLNWDLLNDGMGNPKNTKSHVWSYKTPPVMAHGVRDSMETATKTGFMFIQLRVADEAVMQDVRAYLRSLEPEKSPYLVNGELSPKAKKGKKVFEDAKVGCAQCHPGPLFTDMKLYDVGTRHALDKQGEFDTPTLVEMWRSAPYLHEGTAVTLLDLLTTSNKDDRHGKTSGLSKDDLEALVAYLLSL
jgi:DNA-binding beta-propeller fold protein YncE